jgi:hypothetical protein
LSGVGPQARLILDATNVNRGQSIDIEAARLILDAALVGSCFSAIVATGTVPASNVTLYVQAFSGATLAARLINRGVLTGVGDSAGQLSARELLRGGAIETGKSIVSNAGRLLMPGSTLSQGGSVGFLVGRLLARGTEVSASQSIIGQAARLLSRGGLTTSSQLLEQQLGRLVASGKFSSPTPSTFSPVGRLIIRAHTDEAGHTYLVAILEKTSEEIFYDYRLNLDNFAYQSLGVIPIEEFGLTLISLSDIAAFMQSSEGFDVSLLPTSDFKSLIGDS